MLDHDFSDNDEDQYYNNISNLKADNISSDIKGVCYIKNIPPNLTVQQLSAMLSDYDISRIYLKPSLKKSKNNKKSRSYTCGWIEFTNKRVAKLVSQTLNNQRIGNKKGSKFYDDYYNIKYLPKFKWEYIKDKITYNKSMREQRIMTDIASIKKKQEFIISGFLESKNEEKINNKKITKNRFKFKKVIN